MILRCLVAVAVLGVSLFAQLPEVLYLDFEEGTNSFPPINRAAPGHPMTIPALPFNASYVPGRVGEFSIQFAGGAGLPIATDLLGDGDWTIEVWFDEALNPPYVFPGGGSEIGFLFEHGGA